MMPPNLLRHRRSGKRRRRRRRLTAVPRQRGQSRSQPGRSTSNGAGSLSLRDPARAVEASRLKLLHRHLLRQWRFQRPPKQLYRHGLPAVEASRLKQLYRRGLTAVEASRLKRLT